MEGRERQKGGIQKCRVGTVQGNNTVDISKVGSLSGSGFRRGRLAEKKKGEAGREGTSRQARGERQKGK